MELRINRVRIKRSRPVIQSISVSFLGLEDTTVQLDFRVTTLEENSGSEGNGSIAELEIRVENLESTTANQETRLTTAEANLEGILGFALDL